MHGLCTGSRKRHPARIFRQGLQRSDGFIDSFCVYMYADLSLGKARLSVAVKKLSSKEILIFK
jgi:hypothetical protein